MTNQEKLIIKKDIYSEQSTSTMRVSTVIHNRISQLAVQANMSAARMASLLLDFALERAVIEE